MHLYVQLNLCIFKYKNILIKFDPKFWVCPSLISSVHCTWTVLSVGSVCVFFWVFSMQQHVFWVRIKIPGLFSAGNEPFKRAADRRTGGLQPEPRERPLIPAPLQPNQRLEEISSAVNPRHTAAASTRCRFTAVNSHEPVRVWNQQEHGCCSCVGSVSWTFTRNSSRSVMLSEGNGSFL